MTSDNKFRVATTDVRYFARSNFSRNLVQKKYFDFIRELVFKLEYFFVKGDRIPLLSVKELGEKSRAIITLDNFTN